MGRFVGIGAVVALLCCLGVADVAAKKRGPAVRIQVLSNRADLVSAGDALLAVDPPAGTDASRAARPPQRRGRHRRVRRPRERPVRGPARRPAARRQRAGRQGRRDVKGSAAKLAITNHPNGGPVFSGPQVQPWVCQETAVDAQCNQPAEYEYSYMPEGGSALRALRPRQPALGRGRHDDRRGQDGSVHRPHRDRLPGPRPVQDRDPRRPSEAVRAVGAAGGLEPQAADHARRQLRHRPSSPARRPTSPTTRRSAAASRSCRPRSTTPGTTATWSPRPSRW